MNPLYWGARNLIHILARVLWRTNAVGAQNVPRSGPLIIACNHISFLDPPVMGSFAPRQISYMAKKELFEIPVFGAAIRAVGAYPVDREGSAAAAIKRSVEVLRRGGCIGIFPEGGRNKDGVKEARQGVALLASLGKAPVVPAAIIGSEHANRLGKIKVAFGPAIALPQDRKATREDLAKFTDEVMSAIRALEKSIGGNSEG